VTGLTGLLLAVAAGYGAFLLYTALVFEWRGIGIGAGVRSARRQQVTTWLAQAGLSDVRLSELAAAVGILAVLGAGIAFAVFGGAPATAAGALFAGCAPVAAARTRRRKRRDEAREAWPRMLEEIRLAATTLGRSIPQALFDVGLRGPVELRPAFAAAHREWLLSTDLERSIGVLKRQLADATADAACETLLVAHEVGGSDLDRRLAALIEDRIADLQGRKDAVSKQAGARFARWFVLVVPLGMALVGLSIGDGRAAYATPAGQAAVATGVALVAACWIWAGRLMRLPDEQRVFAEPSATAPAGTTQPRRNCR
jgi:tight adherence protein B